MSADPSQPGFPQRRQFGRRDISHAATATLSTGASVECRLVNVSEGGALLDFPGGLVPARKFRLGLDGVAGSLECEPRHYRDTAVGVQFLSLSDGVRLISVLFPEPRRTVPGGELPKRPERPMAPVAVKDLRQRVFATLSDRPEPSLETRDGA